VNVDTMYPYDDTYTDKTIVDGVFHRCWMVHVQLCLLVLKRFAFLSGVNIFSLGPKIKDEKIIYINNNEQ
jgi:hypothetical protein